MKLKTGIDENLCCGCEACVQICPKLAVEMRKGNGGCFYPYTNPDICVDCGLCQKVCPMVESSRVPLVFKKAECSVAAVHKDEAIAASSSSGGAFTGIVQAFCRDSKFRVFGAQMYEDFSVEHSFVESIEDLQKFRKSKYIPSRTKETFKEAKAALADGAKVVFTGTPCQIAALKLFLKKDFENLLTVDFSCHGVGLPEAFMRYIKDFGQRVGSKVVNYEFRHKARSFADYSSVSSQTVFENGKKIVRYKDPWFRAFVSALFKRPSCFECPFAGISRMSDITIADYWGVDKLSKKMTSGKGVSLILPNTKKAEGIVDKLGEFMYMERFPTEACLRFNIPLNHRVMPNPQAKVFWDALKDSTFEEAVEKALGKPTLLNRIDEYAMRIFPIRTRLKINKACKKFTSGVKKSLYILPEPIREKIFKKWAKAHGRADVER